MEKKDTLDICGECVTHSGKEKKSVPYIVHEADMARMERTIKRLLVLAIVMFLAFAGSNAAWIYYEQQFESFETTITQDNADGYNNYIGNDGDILNGTSDDKGKR